MSSLRLESSCVCWGVEGLGLLGLRVKGVWGFWVEGFCRGLRFALLGLGGGVNSFRSVGFGFRLGDWIFKSRDCKRGSGFRVP